MPIATALYRLYPLLPNRFLDQAFRRATIVIVESGLGILLVPRARAANGAVKIVYLASDELATLGAHPELQRRLEACRDMIDHVCIPSRRMADGFRWARDRVFFVPHGINSADFESEAPNPYSASRNAVCVGSSFFDAGFFVHAASQFPDVEFHLIGTGVTAGFPRNVRVHPEMAFNATIPYIKHATIGIAPYRDGPGCKYLSDTSMKLMQYDYLGIPAVCPPWARAPIVPAMCPAIPPRSGAPSMPRCKDTGRLHPCDI
jgi:2-beta-glucuronyltransferase